MKVGLLWIPLGLCACASALEEGERRYFAGRPMSSANAAANCDAVLLPADNVLVKKLTLPLAATSWRMNSRMRGRLAGKRRWVDTGCRPAGACRMQETSRSP